MLSAKITNVPVRIYICHGLRYQGYGGLMKNCFNDGEDFVRVRDRSDMCFCWSETDIVGRPYM